jgi:type II secretory pathway component PulM
MNVASMNRWPRAVTQAGDRRSSRRRVPLYAWSRRRRGVVAGLVAAITCASAAAVCITNDIAGIAAAEAALMAARSELAEAERAQRALPALRQAAASAARHAPRHSGNSADDTRNVSELAAASGVALVSLAAGAPGGQGSETFRALKLTAQGTFAQLRSFLDGLAHASVLIVPTEVGIERNGPQLLLAATLSVFDALPPLRASIEGDGDDAAAASRDPFATNPAGGSPAGDSLRLAGLLQDRTRALALIETPAGTGAVEAGGRIGGERVVRISMPAVTLAAGGVTHVLTWAEEGP